MRVLSLVGMTALLFGIIEGPERGWTSPIVLATFVITAAVAVAFVRWERVAPHPMLPVSYFCDRRFSVGSATVTVSFFVMFGFFFLFSLYLQFARGYSPLDAGLATLPFAVAFVIVSPRSAALAERIGSGRTIAYGFAIVGIGMVLMALIGVDTPYLVLVVGMVLLSAGMAIVAAPATSGIMNAVPMSKAGVGSAVNDTTRELGGALGIAVFGSIVNSAYRANIDLSGLGLSPSEAAEAEESIGGAAATATTAAGDVGPNLVERAASAFTDAFNLASIISAVIVVASAAIVAHTFTRAKEANAARDLGRDAGASGRVGVGHRRCRDRLMTWNTLTSRSTRIRGSSGPAGSYSTPRSPCSSSAATARSRSRRSPPSRASPRARSTATGRAASS